MLKDIKLEKNEEAFKLCQEVGIKTLATFIVGLPGTTYEENEQIADYAIAIGADYASFNILIPRTNTQIRKEAIEKNWLNDPDRSLDQSGSFGALETGPLSEKQIMRLHKIITRRFYMRPIYIYQKLMALRTPYELYSGVRNGFAVLASCLSPVKS